MALLMLERAGHRNTNQLVGLLEVPACRIRRRRETGPGGNSIGGCDKLATEVQVCGRIPRGVMPGRIVGELQFGQVFVPIAVISSHILHNHGFRFSSVRFVLSTGLHCGMCTGANSWRMLNASRRRFSCCDFSCVPLSDRMTSGHPWRKITASVTAVVTAGAVARRKGRISTHLVKRSWRFSSQVWPFFERGKGPTRSRVTCSHGRFTEVACSVPAGRICATLCRWQSSHPRT